MVELINKKISVLSPWVSITERTLIIDKAIGSQVFHSLQLADYVSVIALDEKGRIPLVRQYRPALEAFTIELPGGTLEVGESLEHCAARELFEETGFVPKDVMKPLPCLFPDSGRLENRLWGFFAHVEKNVLLDWHPEVGVEVIYATCPELQKMISDGEFNHALHIALIGLASIKNYLEI